MSINMLKQKIELENIRKQKEINFEQMTKIKDMIPDWKAVLKNCSMEKKKMILSSIIKEIVVYDNKIDIHLRISFKEYIETAQKMDIDKFKKMNSNFFENICDMGTTKLNTNLGTF